MPNALVADNLCFHYAKQKPVLSKFSLSLPSKGITALLGANGAGKTTFIHCALGLIQAQQGTLSIFNQKAGSQASKQRIGVMLQDTDLPDLLTPREHLTLFQSYYNDAHHIDYLIELCGIQDFADQAYKKLSGGQKRRTQFALALVGKPDLLFLDEPTTGLDINARHLLWDVIRELSEQNTAILLTTHYLEEADALADRTALINQGRVIAEGPSDEIRQRVSESTISCITDLAASQLAKLVAVSKVSSAGRYTEIQSSDAVATLRALFQTQAKVEDIAVDRANLEAVFQQLLSKANKAGSQS